MAVPNLAQDVRFAWRQCRRAPGFAASAVLTLALGIGANTGLFSVLNGMLRPLAVPQADRLVIIAAQFPADDTGFRYQMSYPALADYASATGVFSDVFAYHNQIAGLTAGGKTTQFVYHVVTGNFFSGLQLKPALGRLIAPGEGDHPGGEAIVVLGHALWQRRFGGDPAVIGTIVRLDGQPARIIGVTPPEFHGLVQGAEIDGYVPMGSLRGRTAQIDRVFTDRSLRILTMMARMREGASVASAQAAVDVIAQRLQAQYPAVEKGATARVMPEWLARPIPAPFLSDIMPLVYASMFGLATLVSLIACLNVANLLLVRATARQREMAIRAALGSGRSRLFRLLLTESLLLSIAGLAAGLVLARWAATLFVGLVNPSIDLTLNLDFNYDWRVFAYAGGLALVTGLVMGVMPAVRASRAEVTTLLHDGGHGGSAGGRSQRLRGLLVIAQVAGSVVLLIVAGLCVRNLQRAEWVNPGFDPEHLLTVRLDPRQVGYDTARNHQFYDELERRLGALPGVQSVAMSFSTPMGFFQAGCGLHPEGRDAQATDEPENVFGCTPVSPGYFDTLRIPVLRGRGFTTLDLESTDPVIIVNETLAKRLWPHTDAIGQRVVIPAARPELRTRTVIGIARDSKYLAVFEHPLPYLYLAMKQDPPSSMRVVYIRSSSIPPDTLATRVEAEIHRLDPDMPIADLKTMRQMLHGSLDLLLLKLGAIQAAAMGLLGLLLAVVGIYGVVSYATTQRTREIGIRIALGAKPAAVGWMLIGHGARLVLAGIALGMITAVLATRAIGRFFFFIAPTDPSTFLSVAALLAVVALVACYLPARRAMRVSPIIALRHE